MAIGEFCNREVVIIERHCAVQEAARLMRNHHVGAVVVVDETPGCRVPVGIVTDRDLVIEIMAADELDVAALTVGDVMGPELLTAREDEELPAVIDRMRSHGVRRLPVVNNAGGLEGIVTVDDLLELLAEQTSGLVALIRNEQRLERDRRRPL